jgi:hypothetical protein
MPLPDIAASEGKKRKAQAAAEADAEPPEKQKEGKKAKKVLHCWQPMHLQLSLTAVRPPSCRPRLHKRPQQQSQQHNSLSRNCQVPLPSLAVRARGSKAR